MNLAHVEFSSVWKRYDDVEAVKCLNLNVEQGELLVLVGPSGCGKTTTLRMLAGLETITEGEISIDGQKVNHLAPKDRNIAMVFQNYALYPHMTVRENLGFALKLQGKSPSEIESKIAPVAQNLGIGELLNRKPRQLSGGQRQRVAMGRAIVRKPRVFLFDEPLSNLDAKLRVQMRLQLARLHRELGATMIYVTHDQTEAMTLADRICVMHEGELMQIGTPMSLFNRPQNSFVAGFIGSPSMNILPAEIDPEVPRVIAQDFSLTLSPLRHQSLINQGIEQVLLGMRPQHLHPSEDLQRPGFQATVDVVEPLGAEAYLYLKMGETNIIANTTGKLPEEGESLRFGLNSQEIHLFSEDGHVRLEDEAADV